MNQKLENDDTLERGKEQTPLSLENRSLKSYVIFLGKYMASIHPFVYLTNIPKHSAIDGEL